MVYSAGFQADQRTVNRNIYPWAEDVDGFAVDSRLGLRIGGDVRHDVLVGYDYRELNNLARFGFAAGPSLDAFDPVYGAPIVTPALATTYNDQRVRQGGLYLQDQIRFGATVLTLSGRFDDVDLPGRGDHQAWSPAAGEVARAAFAGGLPA